MVPIEREGDSWSVYYNFDQYVWKPDEKSERGIGLYGRLGFADEDTSPIDWFVGAGLAAISSASASFTRPRAAAHSRGFSS